MQFDVPGDSAAVVGKQHGISEVGPGGSAGTPWINYAEALTGFGYEGIRKCMCAAPEDGESVLRVSCRVFGNGEHRLLVIFVVETFVADTEQRDMVYVRLKAVIGHYVRPDVLPVLVVEQHHLVAATTD